MNGGHHRLLALVRKEFRQALRDPRMVWLLVGVPLLQLILFGFVVNLDVDRLPTALCDLDRSPQTRALAERFFADRTFVLKRSPRSAEDASRLLERGDVVAAVVFPTGFARRLRRGAPAEVQILVDGTDPVRARVAMGAAEQFFGSRALELASTALVGRALASGRAPSLPQIRIEPRLYYNQRLRSPPFMVPGVAATVLMIVTTLVSAMGIAREREMGTLEQVLVTPLGRTTFVAGKILPYALIGLVDVGLILAAGMALFDVPLRGSLATIYAAAALFLLSTLGLGLFISSVSRTQQQALLAGFFLVLPAILLSGFMTPVDNMPAFIRALSYLDPMYYFLEVLRGCMLKGAGFSDFAFELAALGGFGSVIFALSAQRFGKRLA